MHLTLVGVFLGLMRRPATLVECMPSKQRASARGRLIHMLNLLPNRVDPSSRNTVVCIRQLNLYRRHLDESSFPYIAGRFVGQETNP